MAPIKAMGGSSAVEAGAKSETSRRSSLRLVRSTISRMASMTSAIWTFFGQRELQVIQDTQVQMALDPHS